MKIYDWNKLSQKNKRNLVGHTLILGSKDLDPSRIKELTNKKVIFGCFKEKYIAGLKGEQFKALSSAKLTKNIQSPDTIVIDFFQKDAIYLIKELRPYKVIMINGSWSGPIHFRKEYWTCVDMRIPIKFSSAFSKDFKSEIGDDEKKVMVFDKTKTYTDKELLELSRQVAYRSHCWQVQVGCVIAKDGKVLAVSHNYVLPYEKFCMNDGCIREKLHMNPGQDTQICMANHAESELIDYCVKNQIDIKNADIFLSLGPCPVCAKLISRCGISRVIYGKEYSQNDLGFRIIKESNIKCDILE